MYIFWIILIVAAYFIFRDQVDFKGHLEKKSTAEDILKMRYVSGEIDEETYLRIKKEISNS